MKIKRRGFDSSKDIVLVFKAKYEIYVLEIISKVIGLEYNYSTANLLIDKLSNFGEACYRLKTKGYGTKMMYRGGLNIVFINVSNYSGDFNLLQEDIYEYCKINNLI